MAAHQDAGYVAGSFCYCNFRSGGCYVEVGAETDASAAGGLFQTVVEGMVAWAL